MTLPDLNGWPVWAVLVFLALNLIKEPLSKNFPQIFGFMTRPFDDRRERQLFQDDAERQDDIAIMQSMMRLQSQTIQQNERLLDFIINRMDTRLREVAEAIRAEMTDIRTELNDINGRWLTATKQMSNSQNQTHLMTVEISKLVDKFEKTDQRLKRMIERGMVTADD
jgi:hypothetical protein